MSKANSEKMDDFILSVMALGMIYLGLELHNHILSAFCFMGALSWTARKTANLIKRELKNSE